MSSGRSHSDADLEALANYPIPPSSMTPGLRGSRGFVREAMVPHAATNLWELACQRWRWVSQYIRQ